MVGRVKSRGVKLIVPIFGCEDIESATKFYVEILGCKIVASFSLSKDAPNPGYNTLDFNGSHLHLSSFPREQAIGKSAYVYCDDCEEVDRLYAKVKSNHSITMNVPLIEQTWGMYEFGFTDSDGNRLNIGAQLNSEAPNLPID